MCACVRVSSVCLGAGARALNASCLLRRGMFTVGSVFCRACACEENAFKRQVSVRPVPVSAHLFGMRVGVFTCVRVSQRARTGVCRVFFL